MSHTRNGSSPDSATLCQVCRCPDSDLRLHGCGCLLHARCTPLSLVLAPRNSPQPDYGCIPSPLTGPIVCPFCGSGVQGLHLFPLTLDELEQAASLKRDHASGGRNSSASSLDSLGCQQKRARDALDGDDLEGICAYLNVQNSRTGRWTDEEVAFVDFLVSAFDRGRLPLPHGVKLNEFLGEVLLCKSSRLTKKMKNARLSTRSYELSSPSGDYAMQKTAHQQEAQQLAILQERFLQSIPTSSTQLELRFALRKLWRTHFFNLCLQVGFSGLDAQDWIHSLEDLEHRASESEKRMRQARRRRMGLALKTDANAADPRVFVAGVPACKETRVLQTGDNSVPLIDPSATLLKNTGASSFAAGLVSSSECSEPVDQEGREDDMAFLANMLEMAAPTPTTSSSSIPETTRQRFLSEDFAAALESLIGPATVTADPVPSGVEAAVASKPAQPYAEPASANECGPFLEDLVSYMESQHLPFQHVDVWVPSFVPPGDSAGPASQTLRLFHAGHGTRSEGVDSNSFHRLNEYGSYSANFSFSPGVGLVGRVYSSIDPIWERDLASADPRKFERAGGAKVYGIHSSVGFSLSTTTAGRIVVIFYSTMNLPEDKDMMNKILGDLSRSLPEPKWKVTVEAGLQSTAQSRTPPPLVGAVASSMGAPLQKLPHGPVNTMGKFGRGLPSNTQHMISHDHRQKQKQIIPSSPTASPANVLPAPVSSTVSPGMGTDSVDRQIASLLGDHMPVSDTTSPGESTSSTACSGGLLTQFMSLRLLLLRPQNRRSASENELIEILRSSFLGYSQNNRRSGAELANLLAKDWMYLKSSFMSDNRQTAQPSPQPSKTSASEHFSHVMPAPTTLPRFSSAGGLPLSTPPLPPLDTKNHLVSANSLNSLAKEAPRPSSRRGSSCEDSSTATSNEAYSGTSLRERTVSSSSF